MTLSSVRPRLVAIGTVAAVLVALVWYLLLWSPRSAAYNKAHSEVTESEAAIQSLQAQIQQLQAQAKGGSGASNARQTVEAAAIPPEANLAQLIDQINTAANSSGVTFISITPSQPAAPTASSGGASVINVGINTSGGYYQIVDFINRLDSLPRLMVVNGVTMAAGSGTGGSGPSGSQLAVTLSTEVFTTASPAGATSGTKTTTTIAGSTTSSTVAGSATSTTAPGTAPTSTTRAP
jgi:Tfp pilus assembly protein PilO